MSYILEALKKSERERNKGKIPDLQSVHVAPARVNKRSLRPWIYALVVGGNLVFAGLWLYQKYGAPYQDEKVEQVEEKKALEQEATEAVKKPAETAPEVKKKEKTETKNETESEKKQESPIIQPVPETHKPVESLPRLQPDETLISPRKPPTPAAPPTAKTASTPDLPLITELPQEIAEALPALEFFSHMYSSESQYRSVIINGEYLKESQKLNEQLTLEEITEEGVILNYQGVRFRVSVLKDWSFQ